MPNFHLKNITQPDRSDLLITKAESFMQRFIGLMGKKSIPEQYGLLFINKSESRLDAAIHMLCMRFDIAVIWMDDQLCVVDKVIARKWHLQYIPHVPAMYILETHPARYDDFTIGDRLEIQ
ncbi:MAG: DUF192 domain-containing protein [Anaerolineae bacterium]|nr:DUF192 domain-containing protein [Anaerolineae bacterium]